MTFLRSIALAGLSIMPISPALAALPTTKVAYGVDSNVDSLYTIDLNTGVITIIGPLGPSPTRYTTPISLAIRRSDGAMFAANNSPDMDRGISRLDPATGRATMAVPYNGVIQSIAFDARGRLIAQLQTTGRLVVVDLDTKQMQPYGSLDLYILGSLATDPTDGQLYAISPFSSSVDRLFRISADGFQTSTVNVSFSPPHGGGPIAFDASGALFHIASGGLTRIDPATGLPLTQPIAITFPFLPQGFAIWEPTVSVVPTLSTIGLVALVMALFGAASLSRRSVDKA